MGKDDFGTCILVEAIVILWKSLIPIFVFNVFEILPGVSVSIISRSEGVPLKQVGPSTMQDKPYISRKSLKSVCFLIWSILLSPKKIQRLKFYMEGFDYIL